jgi:hypothetical protein
MMAEAGIEAGWLMLLDGWIAIVVASDEADPKHSHCLVGQIGPTGPAGERP